MVSVVVGGGHHEWVWSAIASGDVTVVRAAPASFNIREIHPKYGSVLTAFLQAFLNLEGRFIVEGDRVKRARDLVEELGRRGARPDVVIPSANIEVKGLYQDWRLTGDVTAMQAVIQIRNDLMKLRFEREDECGADDAVLLSELVDKYAELTVRSQHIAGRTLIPDAVVQVWERCFGAKGTGDVLLVSPDGSTHVHSFVLASSSPVVAAMLESSMCEGQHREIRVQEPVRVVELFLSLVYTGCIPQDPGVPVPPKLIAGLRVTTTVAFMSNSATRVLLPSGLRGEVHNLDASGDALIKFDGIPVRQWVTKKNFFRLRTRAAESHVQLQKDLAGTLCLAHYWQVTGLVDVLAERLERDLTAECFEAVLESALIHGAPQLRASCLAFAQNSADVREAYDANSYTPAVLEALHDVFLGGTRKRPRDSL